MSERVFFDAVVEPNRPLQPPWLLIVVAAIALISFIAGIVFVMHGAWPVTPFFGADVLLLYWAFILVRERSHHREHIRLTSDRLTVERTQRGRRATTQEINPYWLRVEHDDPERIGAELALVAQGKRIVVGAYLGADERARLADALRTAIAEARAAPPSPSIH